jgi:flagellar basal-body rod modification protein FlgD
MVTTTAVNPYSQLNKASNNTPTTNEAGSSDRFLKLLVTQLQNQDPLNPTDNAQITSQMAQINTVNGIEQLNVTVAGLNSQFLQLQALTGASLVGRDITLQGSKLSVRDGMGVGGFDLASDARRVQVEILNASGRVTATLDLGAHKAGRHAFDWKAAGVPDDANYTFRVKATSGDAAVSSTALMRDRVEAVNTSGSQLLLETQNNGPVRYSDVKAFN